MSTCHGFRVVTNFWPWILVSCSFLWTSWNRYEIFSFFFSASGACWSIQYCFSKFIILFFVYHSNRTYDMLQWHNSHRLLVIEPSLEIAVDWVEHFRHQSSTVATHRLLGARRIFSRGGQIHRRSQFVPRKKLTTFFRRRPPSKRRPKLLNEPLPSSK